MSGLREWTMKVVCQLNLLVILFGLLSVTVYAQDDAKQTQSQAEQEQPALPFPGFPKLETRSTGKWWEHKERSFGDLETWNLFLCQVAHHQIAQIHINSVHLHVPVVFCAVQSDSPWQRDKNTRLG